MKINNDNIEDLNVEIVSFDYAPMLINTNLMYRDNNYVPIRAAVQYQAQTRNLVLDMKSQLDISNLLAKMNDYFILDIDDTYLYDCYLITQPTVTQESVNAYTVALELSVVQRKAQVTVSTKTFTNVGNMACNCVLQASSTSAKSNVIINGIKIKSLKANSPFIIDGIKGLIYYNSDTSKSEFDNVELIEFPKVTPGANEIECNTTGVSIVCKYYPTFR